MPCFSLSAVSRAEVGELAVVEVRLGEPAVHQGRDGARLLGGPVGGDQRLGLLGQLLERLAADGLARLDHDDRRLRALGDGLRQRPEQGSTNLAGRCGRAHHHQVGALGLAQDRGADVGRLAQERLGAGGDELARERREGALGLGADRLGDAVRDEVHDHDRGVVPVGQGVRDAQRQLRVRAAADGDQDPPDLAGAALLDDGDVAGRLPDDLVDRGADDRGARAPGGRRTCRPSRRSSGPPPARRRPPRCPAAAWRPMRTSGWMTVPSGA